MSIFTSKLGTNYCPTSDEIHEINNLLLEPCYQLRQLESRIAQLQKAMDELVEERRRVAEYVDAHRALLSAVRRMPFDVLAEIFCACLPTERDCDMSASEAPVLLGRICSSWRTTSRSIPRLWASLQIVDLNPMHYGAHMPYVALAQKARRAHRLETATAWLARSGACSLSILLRLDTMAIEWAGKLESWPLYPFFQLVVSYASRWRKIHLVVPDQVIDTLRDMPASHFPLLRNLKVHVMAVSNDSPPPLQPLEMLYAPSLLSLEISGLRFSPKSLGIQYDRLTSLSLGPFSWGSYRPTLEDLLSILLECQRLCCFTIALHEIELDPQAPPMPIECLTLEELTIHYYQGHMSPFRMMNYLSLPALRHLLVFASAPAGNDEDIPAFERFFSISTGLISLYFDGNHLSKTMVQNLVRALPPSLQRLAIHQNPSFQIVDDDFMALMTPDLGSQPVCSGLQDVAIRNCLDLSDVALLKFISAKMNSTYLLKRLRIKFQRLMEVDILPELQSFVDAGLKLVVEYHDPIRFVPAARDRPKFAHEWYDLGL
ncbi:hypothetical protein C8F01DRAFT_1252163 [Mycena amicta]|nr:hypothetical protein C8F01DRAFT_1252163 [Mycena amicta]